jgi:Flp pilus assembly protein TadD
VTPAERRAAFRRAGALVDLDRVEEAAALYGELLRQEPDDAGSLCGLSRCLGKLGRTREALDLASRAAALAPEDDWPHRLRSAHLMRLRRPAEATQAAREAVRLDPSSFAALLTLFETQVGRRAAGEAAATAARVQELFPDQSETHNCLGRVAMLRRDWRAAEAAFQEALRLSPQEPVYQSNLALALERRGHRREAMELFHQAVRTNPGSSSARRQLVHAVDRRVAVVGLASGVAGGFAVLAGRRLQAPGTLAGAVVLLGLAVALGQGLRWWRLRRLDESVRRLYLWERRFRWPPAPQGAPLVIGLALCSGLGFGLTAWLTGSPWLGLAVAAALALIRYPGLRLWRRRVRPALSRTPVE